VRHLAAICDFGTYAARELLEVAPHQRVCPAELHPLNAAADQGDSGGDVADAGAD
jgi:hypothetical protein